VYFKHGNSVLAGKGRTHYYVPHCRSVIVVTYKIPSKFGVKIPQIHAQNCLLQLTDHIFDFMHYINLKRY